MRSILVGAAVMVALGGYAAKYVDTATASRPQANVARVSTQASSDAYSRTVTLAGGRDGHFHVEARVDNAPLDFVVDTGATLVIIRESDANKLRIFPNPSDFTATVSTANGKIKAARATLNRIEIGGITVYDVQALILPDDALWQNLLGMAFLSKLKRYEASADRLVLEQ